MISSRGKGVGMKSPGKVYAIEHYKDPALHGQYHASLVNNMYILSNVSSKSIGEGNIQPSTSMLCAAEQNLLLL